MYRAAQARRTTGLLWSVSLLSIVLAAAAAWWFTHDRLRAALDEGQRQVAGHAGGAVASLNRALLDIDLLLGGAGQVVQQGAQAGPLQAASLAPALAALTDRNLMIDGVAVVDGSGRVRLSSRPGIVGRTLPLPAGFAGAVLAQRIPGMLLSPPGLNLSNAERVLHAARPVDLPGGERWLVVAELPLSALVGLIGPAVDVPGLVVVLERDDGTLLASHPRDERAAGRVSPPAGDAGRASAVAVEHVAAGADPLSGAPALVTWRPTLYRQLRIGASLQEAAVLARPRQERTAAWAVVALIALLTLTGTALSRRTVASLAAARVELQASKALLDQALGAMAEGFLLCDRDDRVVTWNSRYLALFPWLAPVLAPGVPYARLAATAARALKPHASDAECDAWVAQRLALHRRGNGVWQQELSGGVVVRGMDRRTPDGGTVSVFHDFTAEERRLEQARRAAEAANEAKSVFLANVSHEIRTPLNAVLGLAGMLLGTALDERQREYVALMRSSGHSLLTIINDILDTTQIEAGRMKLEAVDFDPRRALQEVASLLAVRAQAKGLPLRLETAPDLPSTLHGDPGRLRQVLFNLVGNAIKFTARGEVRLSAGILPGGLWIEVRDTGIGIPADRQAQVFERFVQADASTQRRYGGSGLGLAITRDIVHLMGGCITLHSEPDAGSVFRVELPFEPGAEAGDTKAPPTLTDAAAMDPAGAPAARQRLLVAEDNPVNQLVIRAVLERMGHDCDIVANGLEALRQVQAAPYDLVLMDLQMPEMDGATATRAIRALPGPAGRVPIVAMTANAMARDHEACRAVGMDDILTKPVEPARLARVVRALCAARAAESETATFELQAG